MRTPTWTSGCQCSPSTAITTTRLGPATCPPSTRCPRPAWSITSASRCRSSLLHGSSRGPQQCFMLSSRLQVPLLLHERSCDPQQSISCHAETGHCTGKSARGCTLATVESCSTYECGPLYVGAAGSLLRRMVMPALCKRHPTLRCSSCSAVAALLATVQPIRA